MLADIGRLQQGSTYFYKQVWFTESLDEEDFAEWKKDEVDEDGDYDENSAVDFLENHGVSVARLDYNEYFDKKYIKINPNIFQKCITNIVNHTYLQKQVLPY